MPQSMQSFAPSMGGDRKSKAQINHAMDNPFGTEDMAAGYARYRPPIHARILERVRSHLPVPVRRALDVGCGAGLSTRALHELAEHCIGIEPAEAMLERSGAVAAGDDFVVGVAEAIPVAKGSINLVSAAGSLNYVNVELFFGEAARVLQPDGVLVIYDFSPGKSFRERTGLEQWFSRFEQRYPPPPNEALELDPGILARLNSGFQIRSQEHLEISVPLSAGFYLNYVRTETNVAWAARNGVPRASIRSWCEDTLGPLWEGSAHEVVFQGYFVCMVPTQVSRAGKRG